jgi:hypothetical protein
MALDYKTLKEKQRQIRESFHENLGLRVHRALSWLQRAELETEDNDARFVFLWIAFNAAYANEISNRQKYSERKFFIRFLKCLIDADDEKLLYNIIWREFPKSVRALINNRYVYQPFWNFHNGDENYANWEGSFDNSKTRANKAIGQMDTVKALAVVFDRLYVLRNQVVHGGATWNSSVNRDQIKNGADIMGHLVPVVIHLMMLNKSGLWGEPCYPVVQ